MKSTEAKLEFPLLLANLKGKGKVPQTGHDALLIVERNTYEDLQSQINATVPTLLPNLKNMIMTIVMEEERPHNITHYALRQQDQVFSLDLYMHLLNIDPQRINRGTYVTKQLILMKPSYRSVEEILQVLKVKI